MRFYGPVLVYDMIRTARRARFLLIRTLYAAFLGFLFWLAYMSAFHWGYRASRYASPQELTDFTEHFFAVFMVTQYVLALLLTPAYVAGAIAEEKERRTLEFMLTTSLGVSEILLSKLLSRLANVGLFVLTGLPVLSLLQLFGGINPQWLWLGYLATGITVVSVGALSIWVSVHVRKPRSAILGTYMLVGAYFMVWFLLLVGYAVLEIPRSTYPALPVEGKVYVWAVEVYQAGNPIAVAICAMEGRFLPGSPLRPTPVELLRNFALFHGVVVLLSLLHAMRRLRPVYMKQTYATSKRVRARFAWGRKPVYTPAMMWKELHGDAPRMGWAGKLMYGLTVIACLVPFGFILYEYVQEGFRFFTEAMNYYSRIVGAIVGVLLFLVIAIRAATSIGSENDRDTMVSLLSTPLTDYEILHAKWWSSIRGAVPLFLLLLGIWGLGLVTGGISLLAVPFMVGSLVCYVMFAASFGLMWGAGARTTTRALMWTIGFMLLWGGAHWIITGFLILPFVYVGAAKWPFYLLAGFTPPFVLGWTGFSWEDPFNAPSGRHYVGDEVVGFWFCSVVGVAVNLLLAFAFWSLALDRFRRASGRQWAR